MKLVLLGSPGTPGEPIERWHDDAFEGAVQLGWDVTFLRAKDCEPADIVRESKGADMLLWMRTHDYNIKGGDGHQMLRRVEAQGVATVGMHFDLYWGVTSRQQRIGREAWWSAQHVFTADGGDRDWESRGVNHHWLPPAFGTRFLGYGAPRRHLQCCAVFVGTNISGIHSLHRSQLLGWAARHWGRDCFRHVGRTGSTKVWGRALNDVLASADMTLGDSVLSPHYWSDRIVRSLGRGALLAYPQTDGLKEWGFDDQVMLTYAPGEFRQILIKRSELDETARSEMTDAGIQLVMDRHLWRHRLQHIAEVVLDGARDYRGGRTAA